MSRDMVRQLEVPAKGVDVHAGTSGLVRETGVRMGVDSKLQIVR